MTTIVTGFETSFVFLGTVLFFFIFLGQRFDFSSTLGLARGFAQ
jgi:hypothetical protein